MTPTSIDGYEALERRHKPENRNPPGGTRTHDPGDEKSVVGVLSGYGK